MCKIFRFFIVLFIFIFCVYILNWVNRSRILEHTMATGTTGNTGSVSENSQTVDRTLKPLYLKNSDIQTSEDKRLSDYDLIDPIMRVIGDDLHCLQLDRNLWRIYLKTLESRNKLLTQGIEINDISASFYDTNPYSSGATSVSQQTLKIRICGLPLSVDESAVHEMLNKLKVKLTSKILYEKIRHPVTNKMTSILNGTRFMYIEPLPAGESLPKFNTCAGLRCKILHFALDSQRTTTYFNAQTVGKQVIQNQYVRTILAAKYVKSLVIYRDRKNVHTMKSRSISLHSADRKTFCLIFTRANWISTASNINPPNMRFNTPKRFVVVI